MARRPLNLTASTLVETSNESHSHPDLLISPPSSPTKRTRVRKKVEKLTSDQPPIDPGQSYDNPLTFTTRPKKTSRPAVVLNVDSPGSSRDGATPRPKRATGSKENEALADSSFGDLEILSWRSKGTTAKPSPRSPRKTDSNKDIEVRKPKPATGVPEPEVDTEAQYTHSASFPQTGDLEDLVVRFRTSTPRNSKLAQNKNDTKIEAVVGPVIVEPAEILPVRTPVDIPPNAPQIIVRNGIPTIVVNHSVIPPFGFSTGLLDSRTKETIGEEIRLAGDAGIHLHQFAIKIGPGANPIEASILELSSLLKTLLEADPSANFVIELVYVHPRNWDIEFPDAKQSAPRLSHLPSISSCEYWDTVGEFISEFVGQLVQMENGGKVIGLHLGKNPWMREESYGHDDSKAATDDFRKWVKSRYSNDVVTLRAAWFNGNAEFDTIEIPDHQPDGVDGDRFIRASRKQRPQVDYHLFLSDAVVHRIGELAYAIKSASEGMLLVGVSYGFTLELSHPGSGHLSLGKLLRNQEVDIITGPPSYRNRKPGGAATFPCPIDSIALNGKLFMLEEDYKTSLSGRVEDDDQNPILRTPQALEGAQLRGAGAALAHASGILWTDSNGQGWLKTPGIWRRAGEILDAFHRRMAAEVKDPEVVVFVDERALAYLVDPNAFTLLIQNVCEAVLRSGLHAGFYLLSDLAHRETFPEAKLYLFMNAWDVRPELRAAIKTRLQRANKVLFWLYAAGLLDSGRESLERTREVTGIAIKPQPFHSKSGTTLVNKRHPLTSAFPDRGIIGGSKLEPSYFAIYDESQEVLGQYSQTGLSSFVVRPYLSHESPDDNWTSVFLGEPLVSPGLIRSLGQLAQAHVYDFQEDTFHVSPPFLSAHSRSGGPRTIPLPPNWCAYNFSMHEFENIEANSLRKHVSDGTSSLFYIGLREEIDALLKANMPELLQIDEIPPRFTNSIHETQADLDVPLMKLADWIGVTESEEPSDEWLLRPSIADFETGEEPEEPEQNMRQHRRKRVGGHRRNAFSRSEAKSPDLVDSAAGVGVMFRKRE